MIRSATHRGAIPVSPRGSPRRCPRGKRPSGQRPAGAQAACPLLDDPLERAVVVFGVIELAAAAGDDAPRAAVARSRRRHRVLAVIAAPALRQMGFAVAERPAVIGV